MADENDQAAELLLDAVGENGTEDSALSEHDTAQPAAPLANPPSAAPPAPTAPPQQANTLYGQLPIINLRTSDPQPASVISFDEHWIAHRPLPKPLGFQVPSSHQAGIETHTITHLVVDFTNPQSVKVANHYTAQVIYRARLALGLPLTRPPTQGPYTQANRDFIMFAHQDYAEGNGGRRIPMPELWEMYHAWFTAPGEATSSMSLNAHIDRRPELKAMRAGYPW